MIHAGFPHTVVSVVDICGDLCEENESSSDPVGS